VKIGELVSNGNFSNGTSGWHTAFNQARGGAEVNDGIFSIDIESPGDSLNSMVLSQGEMNVQGKKAYILSFDAFANGTRDMRVKVIGDDTLIFLDTILDVPTLMSKIKLTLVPSMDAVAKIEFHIGGSRASVSMDNISFHDASWTPVVYKNQTGDLTKVRFNILNSNGRIMFLTGKNIQGRIAIYNLNGSLIRMLNVSEKVLWDRKDSRGATVACGTYIARLKSNTGNKVGKFILR